MSGKSLTKHSAITSDSERTATLRVHNAGGTVNTKSETLLGELQADPREQPHMSLGHYSSTSQLKGFAIELTPDPDPDNSIVAQIATLGNANHYELILHVANYGEKTVTAKIWQL